MKKLYLLHNRGISKKFSTVDKATIYHFGEFACTNRMLGLLKCQ